MPAVPATPAVGGPDHTLDHGTIETILTDLQVAVAALQVQAGVPVLSATGGNNVTLAGTGTGMLTVSVSAVNRDGDADLLDFYYGSAKIFSLNSYGELRLAPASLAHVAQVINVLAGQSADALQILGPAGQVLARIGPDGSASFAGTVTAAKLNVSPTWQHCPTQNSWSPYQNRFLTCKLCPENTCHISGHLVPDINHCHDGTIIATVPPGCSPVSRPECIFFGQQNCTPNLIGGHFQIDTFGNVTVWNFGTWQDNCGGHVLVNHRYALDAN